MNLIMKQRVDYVCAHLRCTCVCVCVSVCMVYSTHMSVEVILNLEFNSSHLSVLVVCPIISTKCLI